MFSSSTKNKTSFDGMIFSFLDESSLVFPEILGIKYMEFLVTLFFYNQKCLNYAITTIIDKVLIVYLVKKFLSTLYLKLETMCVHLFRNLCTFTKACILLNFKDFWQP